MRTQEGANVGVCAVEGNFDDAQTGVKKLFSDEALREKLDQRGYFFSSANSINWGRVLPQIVYYVSSYAELLRTGAIRMGEEINICVPTGNFGNILAAYYAKRMGVPIHKLICASNSNNVLTDFLRTGVYDRNRPFYTTVSPSMDILISSNLERLLYALSDEDDALVRSYMEQLNATGRYEVNDAIKAKLTDLFAAGCTTEEETRQTIGEMWDRHHYLIDTHSAVAFHVLEQYRRESGDNTCAVVASTASPFKFGDAVLESIGVAQRSTGVALLDQLSQVSGLATPAPLAALKHKTPRFDQCVAKDHMEQAVLEFLN
jgi:threonine synthase